MAIEIVDFPIKNGGSFHSYVSLPEGISLLVDGIPLLKRAETLLLSRLLRSAKNSSLFVL